MANTGYYDQIISNSGGQYHEYLRLAWSVNSQSIPNNTSNVTFSIQIYSTYPSGSQPYSLDTSSEKTVSLSVAGVQRYYAHNNQWQSPAVEIDFRNTSSANPATLGSWTGTITHNSDGTSPQIALSGTMYYGDTDTSHSGLPGNHVVNYNIPAGTFTTIARASQPTCPANSQFGSAIKITTNRASSSFTHTLVFSCNGNTQTVNNVGAEYNFTIPASWAPTNNADSKTLTVTCTTYNGSTNLGSKTCTSTVAVPSSWVPSVNITYGVTNPGPNNTILANVSTIWLTATGTASQYASISSYVWSGGYVSGTGANKSYSPTAVGVYTFTVTVTDSRGRTGTATLTLSCGDAASTVTATPSSIIFGDNLTVNLVKREATFTHTINYKINGTTIATSTNVDTQDVKQIPTSGASALPNDISGTLVVEVLTYDGNALVGSSSTSVTISIPNNWAPSIGSVSLTAVNAFNGQYLLGISSITAAAVSPAASTGANIDSIKFYGIDDFSYFDTTVTSSPWQETSPVLNHTGASMVYAQIRDSRGLTAIVHSPAFTTLNYARPFLSITAHRCNSQGVANDLGEYLNVTLTGTFASNVLGNTWSAYVYMREYEDPNDPVLVWSLTNQNGTVSVTTSPIAASINSAYEVSAVITDGVGESSDIQMMVVSTGKVLMDFYKDNLVTFHTPASEDVRTDLGETGNAVVMGGTLYTEQQKLLGPMIGFGAGRTQPSKNLYLLPFLTRSDLSVTQTNDYPAYCKALLMWLCAHYPDVDHGIWLGVICPGNTDVAIVHIYDTTNNLDQDGYPQYASLFIQQVGGNMFSCGFLNHVWYFKTISWT